MHGRYRPIFSFEFFPPKTDDGARHLMTAVADLKSAWSPDFVSVTYGAGGSTRDRTIEVVGRIQKELNITTMAHLTCVGSTRAEIGETVDRLRASGIENILALRGDAPKEAGATFQTSTGGFAHASELVGYLKSRADVDIGAACYPETHVESKNAEDDLKWTRHKVEQGVQFLITQLFFDNECYWAFVDRARRAGIQVPIVPGIMPITNVAQVERFTQMCGASIPRELSERLQRVKDDPALVMATGIEHAIRQCRKLLEGGAPGLHFYTLNKSHATRCILAAVRRD
ncbi:MAG: methylenetetrahydrofolate reductase [NAD(P)H] [Planctomycetes bacterium]|nr:methylenetetrahydrofolate reductase [NAD(P)H] [Planctomycetota bacterium]